jgi:uncharacterized protein YggT (Ycf19 family)
MIFERTILKTVRVLILVLLAIEIITVWKKENTPSFRTTMSLVMPPLGFIPGDRLKSDKRAER